MPLDESLRNLERFQEMVVADRRLFTQLRGTADLESFVALAVHHLGPIVRRRAWLERWL